jgi:hypothetical protein
MIEGIIVIRDKAIIHPYLSFLYRTKITYGMKRIATRINKMIRMMLKKERANKRKVEIW